MKIEKFDELLIDYNLRLSKLSKDDISFKISVKNAATIFFRKLNDIDKNLIDVYFENLDKQNIQKNEVHQYALNYLILLTIKHINNSDLFLRFFPEYVDKEPLQRSNWLIVHWFNILISWIFKPKPKLLNLIEARNLLNALRNIKARLNYSENDLLLDVELELENYNSFSLVVEKLLESKISSVIYNPINKKHLTDFWQITFKNRLENTLPNQSRVTLKVDTLLQYLNNRIKSLSNMEKRGILLKEIVPLKSFVYAKQFSLFNEKANEIIKIVNDEFMYQDTFKISGIYHLIEGIKQHLELLCADTINQNLNNQQDLPPHFRDLFYSTIDKIQFFFEHYKENLDKQSEKCFVNSTNLYNILNRLEGFLYVNINLCDHTFNQIFDNAAYIRLSHTMALMQDIAKDLKACTEVIDSKLLQNDITELSQFIDAAISPLQIALNSMPKSSSIQNGAGETDEIYQDITNGVEDDDTDSEWDDDESDISETLSQNRALHSQDLGLENPQTNSGEQSDSGISDEEEFNSNHNLVSNCPHTSLFWKTPINDATTANPESISQQILVN